MLTLRPITPQDKQALEHGLHRLSDRSVYMRFLAPKTSFSSSELRYLTEVDGHDHVALVIDDPDDPGEIIAVGRWVRLAEEPTTADIAITVADCWQRRGVGSLLAAALAEEAHRQGILRFTATMSAQNTAAHRLLHKATGELEVRHGQGVADAVLTLPRVPEAA